ncbi:MAG: right-handed parallel beta-helix repeat-containing protein [Solirubrobacteraceae bacterium]|nr:right-handed parallel beta-helix repeat-containing protein [Solirubrobacteraceae bacterium]
MASRVRTCLSFALSGLALAVSAPSASASVIHVDPRSGADANTGTRSSPLKSLDAAWRRARTGTTIRLAPGRVRLGATYYERKRGIRISGAGTTRTTVPAFNVFAVRDMEIRGLTVDGDVHCEACDGFTLHRVRVQGKRRMGDVVKINQSRRITIRESDISGGTDNALDLVAVQHATITRTTIHDAEDWCAYAKGGSAHVRVWRNVIRDCGTGGFTAGQGTGFQFMVAPWLRYEAYDVRVWNNQIRDTHGAGLGANGAYNALFARNTLVRVGARSHALEAVFGLRSCDGRPGDEGRQRCARNLAAGGWGTTRVDDGTNAVRIPNRHVWFYDNVIVKAPGSDTISAAGPFAGAAQDGSNVPRPALADDDLRLVGNVVTEDAPGSGPPTPLPAFVWDDAHAPAPRLLDHGSLPDMPSSAGASG